MKGFINFLRWVTLTYSWLHVNVAFAAAILEAIENHNDAIRQEALQELCEEDEEQDSEPEQPGAES